MGKYALKCSHCKEPTAVVDSRAMPDGHGIRRRRRCSCCGARFTTYEYAVPEHFRLNKTRAALIASVSELMTK